MCRVSRSQAHLRSVDVRLMQQLLSINEDMESLRWVLEERGGGASVTDSLCSLSDAAAESERGSCSDGLDGISLGSYLDALGDEELEPSLSDGSGPPADQESLGKAPRVETDEYYCFG